MLDTHAGAGGSGFHGSWGISVAPNLTPHPQDGIADYSDAELKMMITQEVRPGRSQMTPPMPYGYFANATPEDLGVIILYLRSLAPLPLPDRS